MFSEANRPPLHTRNTMILIQLANKHNQYPHKNSNALTNKHNQHTQQKVIHLTDNAWQHGHTEMASTIGVIQAS